jgi:hypothetical protein
MRKLTALIAALVPALAAPAASVAGPGREDQDAVPDGRPGQGEAKGHAKKAKQASGKGKKCGHRPPTTVPPIVDPAPTGGGEDGTGGTPPTDGGTGDAPPACADSRPRGRGGTRERLAPPFEPAAAPAL